MCNTLNPHLSEAVLLVPRSQPVLPAPQGDASSRCGALARSWCPASKLLLLSRCNRWPSILFAAALGLEAWNPFHSLCVATGLWSTPFLRCFASWNRFQVLSFRCGPAWCGSSWMHSLFFASDNQGKSIANTTHLSPSCKVGRGTFLVLWLLQRPWSRWGEVVRLKQTGYWIRARELESIRYEIFPRYDHFLAKCTPHWMQAIRLSWPPCTVLNKYIIKKLRGRLGFSSPGGIWLQNRCVKSPGGEGCSFTNAYILKPGRYAHARWHFFSYKLSLAAMIMLKEKKTDKHYENLLHRFSN